MTGLTIYDYVLFPIYLFLVFLIFKKIRAKYADNQKLFLYFTWGFRIKIVIIIVYSLLSHYMIRGDAVDLYFGEGKHFAKLISDDVSNVDLLFTKGGPVIDNLASDEEKGYLSMENNYMVVKVSVILCFLSFSCFMIVNLIIGFIAFLASWQLYLFFLSQYPKLHKEFAFACMGIPTVLFWSAGISKDTICISCIGFMTKAMYDLSQKSQKRLRNILISVVSMYLIFQIKSYIIISYVPFFLLFLILNKINATNNNLLRFAFRISIPVVFIGVTFYIITNSQELLAQYSSEKILESISTTQNAFTAQSGEGTGSFFSLGEFDPSITGLLTMAPKSIIATFFRPFIWESRNLIMMLSSLEAMALLIFTLYTLLKPKGAATFFKSLVKNAIVFYSIAFAVTFAIFVGISTFNFGSLVRYKIPCIPFFIAGLFIINFLRQEKVSAQKQEAVVL